MIEKKKQEMNCAGEKRREEKERERGKGRRIHTW